MALEPSELFPEVPNLYEFPSVHAGMIFDQVRVNAYARAIRATVSEGAVVADVGTGTGLLAFLALQAGAARVHAIDRSPVIEHAKRLAEANGFTDRIVFHQGDAREIELGEQVDVIVSELIGHVAFEEGMVETLFDAVERFGKPSTRLVPESATLFAAPAFEPNIYSESIDCWNQTPFGLDFSLMRQHALKTGYLSDVPGTALLAEQKPVFTVNFVAKDRPRTESLLGFVACRSGNVNGVAFWFDTVLSGTVSLSSRPGAQTHWKQCFVPIPEPLVIKRGDSLTVRVAMKLRSSPADEFKFNASISVNS